MLRAPMSLVGSTRRGMATAQVALSLSALMAMLAVVADGGLLLVERRHAQATADAAALAAASDIYAKWYTEPRLRTLATAACNSAMGVASANGYTNDGTTSKVIVNVPPQVFRDPMPASTAGRLRRGDRDAGTSHAFFSGIFGSGVIPVSAALSVRGSR